MDYRNSIEDEITAMGEGNAISDAPEKIKRMSREAAALGLTEHQLRFSGETLMPGGGYYLSPCSEAPREDGSINWRARHDKATAAVGASWAGHREWVEASCRRRMTAASLLWPPTQRGHRVPSKLASSSSRRPSSTQLAALGEDDDKH